MDTVISAISSIRKNGLTHSQFEKFSEDVEADYGDVMYYCKVRWISRGGALQRFKKKRKEFITSFR